MNRRGWLLVTLAIAIAASSCHRSLPPPSGSPNDELYEEQRKKRQDYSESTSISACSERSGNCYPLTADIDHHFSDQGRESVTVERVYFENGGYLDFGVPIPGHGTDSKGTDWSFDW